MPDITLMKKYLEDLHYGIINTGVSSDFFDLQGLKNFIDSSLNGTDTSRLVNLDLKKFIKVDAIQILLERTKASHLAAQNLHQSLTGRQAQLKQALQDLQDQLSAKDLSRFGFLSLRNRLETIKDELDKTKLEIIAQERILIENIDKLSKLARVKTLATKQMTSLSNGSELLSNAIIAMLDKINITVPVTENEDIIQLKKDVRDIKLIELKIKSDLKISEDFFNEKASSLGVKIADSRLDNTKIMDGIVLEKASIEQLENIVGVLTIGKEAQQEKLKKNLKEKEVILEGLEKRFLMSKDIASKTQAKSEIDIINKEIISLNARITEAEGSEDDLMTQIKLSEEPLYLDMLANKIWRAQENLLKGNCLSQSINFEKDLVKNALDNIVEKEQSLFKRFVEGAYKLFGRTANIKLIEKSNLVVKSEDVGKLNAKIVKIGETGKKLTERYLETLRGKEKRKKELQSEALVALLLKIKESKIYLKSKRKWTNRSYYMAGAFAVLSGTFSVLKNVPALNVVAEPISRVLDLIHTGFLSSAHVMDPTATEADKKRAKETFATARKWKLLDAAIGTLGGMAIAGAAIATVVAAVNPLTILITTVIGSAATFISSLASIKAASLELDLQKEVGINQQTGKPYPGHLLRKNGLEYRLNSKKLNSTSSFLLCAAACLAVAAFFTGPLAPVLLLTASMLAGVAAACSIASVYCVKKEKELLVAAEHEARMPIEKNLKKSVLKLEEDTNELSKKHGLHTDLSLSARAMPSTSPLSHIKPNDVTPLIERIETINSNPEVLLLQQASQQLTPKQPILTTQKQALETNAQAAKVHLLTSVPSNIDMPQVKVEAFIKKIQTLPGCSECNIVFDKKEMNIRISSKRLDHVCNTANQLVQNNLGKEFKIIGKNKERISQLLEAAEKSIPQIRIVEIKFGSNLPCNPEDFKRMYLPSRSELTRTRSVGPKATD